MPRMAACWNSQAAMLTAQKKTAGRFGSSSFSCAPSMGAVLRV